MSPSDPNQSIDGTPADSHDVGWRRWTLLTSEDWWAVWLGGFLLLGTLLVVVMASRSKPDDFAQHLAEARAAKAEEKALEKRVRSLEDSLDGDQQSESLATAKEELASQRQAREKLRVQINPLASWVAKPSSWSNNPAEAFYQPGRRNVVPGMVGVFACALLAFGLGCHIMGRPFREFAVGFCLVFLLATLAYVVAAQKTVKSYNLEYALWALVAGLVISNMIGTPAWLKSAARTEFYIKTGLVLLGAEVLFGRLLTLGIPGVFVAWVVTPIVLVSTFVFGQRVLKIHSPSLNMVISADMSVCGVSAAIATAAACNAKKEELSLAIGMSLGFTVVMMVVMPWVIGALGMSDVLGGAWMGGTIDSTGAVAAAGGMLSDTAMTVAATIKMIQNILIGIVAFCVAVYWVTYVETEHPNVRPSAMEIWRRFPKFVLGFVGASIVSSLVYSLVPDGDELVYAVTHGTSKTLRGWFFCLAFVSIGLETNFRQLAKHFQGGKPLVLYLSGQTLNLCLTLAMAWLMFEVIFADDVARILSE